MKKKTLFETNDTALTNGNKGEITIFILSLVVQLN